MATDAGKLTIDVISDVVCPWCYVGMRRLDKALAGWSPADYELRWRPYQLDPSIPAGGLERKPYMLNKIGSEEKLQEISARLEAIGAQEAIDFDFDAIAVSPSTLDAHRVIRWAASAQGEHVQHKMVARLFELYFENGANIGDHGVLVEAARQIGLDAALIETLLTTDQDKDAVEQEIETARQMGVTGVPCFLLAGQYAVVGAQETEQLADALRQVKAQAINGSSQ